ncbi:hypothetical protein [Microbispora sp. H10885]|uniref:hypothetical protein n=1 Tax=Microbispora sp. H10885 TaxID=2729110 RepID=UPI001602A025|nr:hypothetical protein [Microbispora sp. H10885]
MLYRILADTITSWVDADIPRDGGERPSGTRLRGAWASGGPCSSLDGLRLPPLNNHRVRFWYTEEGWRVYGRAHWAELREAGHTVRVIRVKNAPDSRVAYRDRYQVALLPPSPGRR